MEIQKQSFLKRYVKFVLIFLILCISAFVLNLNAKPNVIESLPKVTSIEQTYIYKSVNEHKTSKYDSIRNALIKHVDMEIRKSTRGKYDKNLPEHLVDNALKHNIDLCFMMSQTKIETCYGTAGIGRHTSKKSLFGVMKRSYTNYNDAINDWCLILKKSYLVKGKTEAHLMRSYVTGSGYRYASSGGYERKLSSTYNSLNRSNPKILELFHQLKQI